MSESTYISQGIAARLEALYEAIGDAVVASIEDDWHRAVLELIDIDPDNPHGGHGGWSGTYFRKKGLFKKRLAKAGYFVLSDDFFEIVEDLNRIYRDEGLGTWMNAEFILERDGSFEFNPIYGSGGVDDDQKETIS